MNEDFKSFNPSLEIVKDMILNFIIPLVSLSISIGVGVLIAYPAYNDIPVIRSEIEQQTVVYNKLNNKSQVLKKLVDYKVAVDENGNLLNKVLVSEPTVPELLTQIDQIVTEAGLTVTKLSYSYGANKEQTGYNSVEVSLSADGAFEQLVQFVQNIENAARLINIKSLRYTFSPATDVGQAPVRATFALVSPYLLIESEAVTDEPVTIDITDEEFLEFMNEIKQLRYYDIRVPIFPLPAEGELLVGTEETEEVVEETGVNEPVFGTPDTTPVTDTVFGEGSQPSTTTP